MHQVNSANTRWWQHLTNCRCVQVTDVARAIECDGVLHTPAEFDVMERDAPHVIYLDGDATIGEGARCSNNRVRNATGRRTALEACRHGVSGKWLGPTHGCCFDDGVCMWICARTLRESD